MSNPHHQFATTNADVDLTSAVSVFNESNAGSFTRWVVLRFEIGDGVKDLASAADTVLTFEILRGGKFLATIDVIVLGAHAQASKDSEPITWKAGETIAVTLLSDQAGDTDVDVTVECLDVAPLQSVTSGRSLIVESDGVTHGDVKEVAGVAVAGVADFRATTVTVSDKTGFSLSPAGILSIWHQALATIVTAGSVGRLIKDFLDATISSRSSHSALAAQADVSGLATQLSVDDIPTAAENAIAVESAILDEGDATALLSAIASKVEEFLINDGDATATLSSIATAVNAAIVSGQIGTDLTAVLGDTNEIQQDDLPALIADVSAPSVEQIEAEIASRHGVGSYLTGAGGGGSGPISFTIKVDDGITNLEGAKVRLYKDVVDDYIVKTLGGALLGIAQFDIPAGTYRVTIIKSGYTFTEATLTVSIDGAVTYSMTANIPVSPPPPFINAQYLCLNANGTLNTLGVVTSSQSRRSTLHGYASGKGSQVITADANAVAWVPVLPGASYKVVYESAGISFTVDVPENATEGYKLRSVFG